MKRSMVLMVYVFFVFALSACGGGGGGGDSASDSNLDFRPQITEFSITDLTGQDSNLQLSDSFKLSADLYTPYLTYVDYNVITRVTNDLYSSPTSLNSYDIFEGRCLGEGDCPYTQSCSVSTENNIFYIQCDGNAKININNIVSDLPATLFFEIAACSDDGCNYEYQHITIEADDIIDNGIHFIKSENADINKSYQSNTIEINGINTEVAITISKGKIVKNGIELAGHSSSVVNGDKISVRLDSYSSLGVTESMDVIIGGVTLIYSVTTGSDFNADFSFITNGTYSAVGSNYYYLTMPSAGTVDFTMFHIAYSNVKIYDLSMNKIDDISSETVSLSAGSYIVKIYNEYYDKPVTVYSPIFDVPSSLPQLTNGTYSAVGSNYYYLTMPSAGTVDFTMFHIAYSNVKIYDLSMNKIDDISSETVSLSAGSYIVKIYNEYYDKPVTVYSSLL